MRCAFLLQSRRPQVHRQSLDSNQPDPERKSEEVLQGKIVGFIMGPLGKSSFGVNVVFCPYAKVCLSPVKAYRWLVCL